MSLAKNGKRAAKNGKSLILKGFLFSKCVMSLIDSTLTQIIILTLKLAAAYRPLAAYLLLLTGRLLLLTGRLLLLTCCLLLLATI